MTSDAFPRESVSWAPPGCNAAAFYRDAEGHLSFEGELHLGVLGPYSASLPIRLSPENVTSAWLRLCARAWGAR